MVSQPTFVAGALPPVRQHGRLPKSSRRRPRPRPHPAPTSLIPPPPPPPPPRTPGDGSTETALSRRVFLLGTLFSTGVTAAASYRFFVGDDEQARLRRRLARFLPFLREGPDDAVAPRAPLDPAFAAAYFDAFATVAARDGVLATSALRDEETEVRARAQPLFFQDDGAAVSRQFDNAQWLNFALYARLHALSAHTSPQSRRQLADAAARAVLPSLGWQPGGAGAMRGGKTVRRSAGDAMGWREDVGRVLDELVRRGWLASWRIEQFDAAAGSSWTEEGRMSFTLFSINPATMQAAQLIGEEQYEELSPKVSAFVNAVLVDVGLKVSFEDYYLDDVYRPDPDQFRPTQLATQFDVSQS